MPIPMHFYRQGDAVTGRWWLCPNDPPCGHGAALHDIEDYGDDSPICCIEGCRCGRQVEDSP